MNFALKRWSLLIWLMAFAGGLSADSGFHCPRGDPVSAPLGDGIIMRTCLWHNEAKQAVRVGPLELIKNGILILKTQTNFDGQLHGRFTSWSDDGVIIKDGFYHLGRKHGPWLETDADGNPIEQHYHAGKPVDP
jgi:hypothetical protein